MARKARWAAPPEAAGSSDLLITSATPVEVVRQVFARNLWGRLVGKGWNQSELARRADISRDSVSTYVRGLALPDPVNMQKMADVLGISVQELNPASAQVSTEESLPSVELKQAVGNPSRAWLRINKEVPFDVAVKILNLLQAAED